MFRIIFKSIIFLLTFNSLAVAANSKQEVIDKALEIMKSKRGKLEYSRVTETMVSLQRWIGAPVARYGGEYVLLAMPEVYWGMAKGFAKEGGVGLTSEAVKAISKDACMAILKKMVDHPAAVAEAAGYQTYCLGYKLYKDNVNIYDRTIRKGQTLKYSEAKRFLINDIHYRIISLGKDLWNERKQYERKSKKSKLLGYKDLFGGAIEAGWDVLEIWKHGHEIMVQANVGLPSYPPYKKYMASMVAVNSEMDKMSEFVKVSAKPGTQPEGGKIGRPGTGNNEYTFTVYNKSGGETYKFDKEYNGNRISFVFKSGQCSDLVRLENPRPLGGVRGLWLCL